MTLSASRPGSRIRVGVPGKHLRRIAFFSIFRGFTGPWCAVIAGRVRRGDDTRGRQCRRGVDPGESRQARGPAHAAYGRHRTVRGYRYRAHCRSVTTQLKDRFHPHNVHHLRTAERARAAIVEAANAVHTVAFDPFTSRWRTDTVFCCSGMQRLRAVEDALGELEPSREGQPCISVCLHKQNTVGTAVWMFEPPSGAETTS